MRASAAAKPVNNPAAPTPLSILDLLLCMVTISFGLTISRLHQVVRPSWSSYEAFNTISTCLLGAAVASLVRFVARWRRGERPILAQPGHWLLWNTGVISLLHWAIFYLTFWCFYGVPGDLEEASAWHAILFLAGYVHVVGVAAALNIYAAFAHPSDAESVAWRVYFLVMAGLCLIQTAIAFLIVAGLVEARQPEWMPVGSTLIVPWLPTIFTVWSAIQPADLLVIGAVAAWDWHGSARRDWLHRVGVGLLLAISLCSTIQSVAQLVAS